MHTCILYLHCIFAHVKVDYTISLEEHCSVYHCPGSCMINEGDKAIPPAHLSDKGLLTLFTFQDNVSY